MLLKTVFQLIMVWTFTFIAVASDVVLDVRNPKDIKKLTLWGRNLSDAHSKGITSLNEASLYQEALGHIEIFDKMNLEDIDSEFAQLVGAYFCGLHWIQEYLGPGQVSGKTLTKPFYSTPPSLIAYTHSLLRTMEPKLSALIRRGLITLDDLWLEDLLPIDGKMDRGDDGKITGELTINNALSPVKFCRMLPSSSPSTHLIVGGERTEGEPLPTDVYTLNVDILQSPDMLADACNKNHLISLPDNKFSRITFDFIDHSILNDLTLLCEYKRILQGGGTVLFKTQHATEAYYTDPKKHAEIMSSMSLLRTLFADVELKPKLDDSAKWGDATCYLEFSFKKL